MKKANKLFSILFTLCVIAGLAPCAAIPARAEGEAQAQPASWNGMYGVAPGDMVYLGTGNEGWGIAWRVLSLPGDETLPVSDAGQALLISAYAQGKSEFGSSTAWANSTAQAWCASYDTDNPSGLTDAEKAAIVQTTVEETSGYSFLDPQYSAYKKFGPASLSEERFFLLSAEEANTYFANNADRVAYASEDDKNSGTPLQWWLRSPEIGDGDGYAGCVYKDGDLYSYTVTGKSGMRPAFNLRASDVIYAASAGGKYELPDTFTLIENDTHNWKLTLRDENRTGFSAAVDRTALNAGDTVTVSYSGAKTGQGENVSAVLYNDEGELLGYACRPVAEAGGSTGTVAFTLPLRAGGSCTMRVFNEQRNGDYRSDYAGNVVDIALTVTAKPGASAETAYEIGGETEAEAWTNLKAALSSSGARREDGEDAGHPTHYRLTADCADGVRSEDSYLEVRGRHVVLDLNGKKLDRGLSKAESCLSKGQVIRVGNSASLTIDDSAGGGVITGGYGDYGGGISVEITQFSSTLTLRGGTITGNRANTYGGGVHMFGGTLVLCGAAISQNAANHEGGGVYCDQTCSACMIESGTISDNTAGRFGGGICAARSFTINGGRITGNRAQNGGGVSAAQSFTMNGGEISENEANNGNGGGVHAANGGTFTGGRIAGNAATGNGGGVFCVQNPLALDGCTISGNRAQNGGGVYAEMFCTLTMREGSLIAGNEADAGGGLYLNGSLCTMTGGRITGNNARSNNRTKGGGVYCNLDLESKCNVSGSPVIAGNRCGGSFKNGVLIGGAESNVYLEWDIYHNYHSRITVAAALTDGARIGVSGPPNAAAAVAAADYQNGQLTEADVAHFKSDALGYGVELRNGEAVYALTETGAGVYGAFNDAGALVATVRAPDGGMLIAASYDANGRMVGAMVKFCDTESEKREAIPVAAGARYRLMLVDENTYAPLCEAWDSNG